MTVKDLKANEVILGCISKREVALMYFPLLGDKAAANALSRTIRENAKLREELMQTLHITSINDISHLLRLKRSKSF